jgi:thiopurine S-methyltransferase
LNRFTAEMEPRFWHARWASGQTAWHLDVVNPMLERHWSRMEAAPGTRVLVPLCGRSRDLAWLADRGHRVLGVEIDARAVRGLFADAGLEPVVARAGSFTRYTAGAVEVLCGDIFDLGPEQVAGLDQVYDRAALIALPPPARRRYAEHLLALLPDAQWLLITLDYDAASMQGPPFAVAPDEVEGLFADRMAVACLEDVDIMEASPGLRARGATGLRERVSRLRPVR